MEPLPVLFWRFATAAAFSWLYLSLRSRTRASLRALSQRRVLVLLLLGALYVGNSFAYFAALQVVPISLTSIITYLYPAIVAVMAAALRAAAGGPTCLGGAGPLDCSAWRWRWVASPRASCRRSGASRWPSPTPVIYATWIVLQARLAGDRPAGTADADGR